MPANLTDMLPQPTRRSSPEDGGTATGRPSTRERPGKPESTPSCSGARSALSERERSSPAAQRTLSPTMVGADARRKITGSAPRGKEREDRDGVSGPDRAASGPEANPQRPEKTGAFGRTTTAPTPGPWAAFHRVERGVRKRRGLGGPTSSMGLTPRKRTEDVGFAPPSYPDRAPDAEIVDAIGSTPSPLGSMPTSTVAPSERPWAWPTRERSRPMIVPVRRGRPGSRQISAPA